MPRHGFSGVRKNAQAVIYYLDEREMVTNVYYPSWEPVELTSDNPDNPTHAKAIYLLPTQPTLNTLASVQMMKR